MNAYVLDASVAAKWFLPSREEPLAAEAAGLLRRYVDGRLWLSVPDLFWPEFGNILWKSVRARRIAEESARKAAAALAGLAIPTHPTPRLLEDALRLSLAFDRSVCDCVYVALAVALNRPLVTADERLADAVGTRLPVRWLGAV